MRGTDPWDVFAKYLHWVGYTDRWSDQDVEELAGWLSPFVPEDGRVLDLGGGAGALAARLADALRARATVLDPSEGMASFSSGHGSVEFVLGCAEDMPLEDDDFDALVVSDAFHHFEDQERAATEMARVVRPGGGVVVMEADRGSFAVRVMRLIEVVLGVPSTFLTPDELVTLLHERGIEGTIASRDKHTFTYVGSVR